MVSQTKGEDKVQQVPSFRAQPYITWMSSPLESSSFLRYDLHHP